jgi:hypothetical protein
MGVSLERAGEILALNFGESIKEDKMTASGVIEKKKVEDTQWGNRLSFCIGHRWYSVFENNLKDQHTKDLLHGLKEGDEVDLDVVEKPNKNKPGESFYNIVGAVKVDRLGADVPAREPSPAGSREASNRMDTDHRGESDTRIRSMALSYAKDWCISVNAQKDREPVRDGYFAHGDVIIIAKAFEQYIQTGE